MASDLRHSDLEAFIVRVQMDHGLQEKLRPFADRESFVAAVLHISLELGFVVSAVDVEHELRGTRARWVESHLS
ncbi:MAG TPA: hypothetical protein VFB34_11555 [Chloroflexota bacterium]|nr:hypothetical protein [Chloroflexota bacterium]